jgi:aspartyl-tRNA synthetase
MFADDVKVSKGMVKYACGIPKESIVDVGGILTCPQAQIESATQKDVSEKDQSLRV